MAKIPRPIHVFGDLNRDNPTTAFEFYKSDDQNDYLFCGSQHGQIFKWSLSTYRCERQYTLSEYIHNDDMELMKIKSIIYSNKRQILIIEVNDGNIYLFNSLDDKLKLMKQFPTLKITFATIAVLNDQFIVSIDPNDSKQMNLYDLDKLKLTNRIKLRIPEQVNHGMIMSTYSFLDVDKFLYNFIAYEDGYLILFKSETAIVGDEISTIESESISSIQIEKKEILNLDFNVNIERGIACLAPNEIVIWKTKDQNKSIDESKIKKFTIENSDIVTCCSIRSDGKIFAVGSKDGKIRIYSMKKGQLLAVLTYHHDFIKTIGFDYLNRFFASSSDGTISIWSLYS